MLFSSPEHPPRSVLFFYIVLSRIQWLLQSWTKLLEKVSPSCPLSYATKLFPKRRLCGKKTPSPNSMFLPTNAQGSGFLLNTRQHCFQGKGERKEPVQLRCLEKYFPSMQFSQLFLSKIVVPILNYLLHIFWLLFSFYSIGLLVILETHVTCIRLKYIKRRPCIRPKFVLRESTLSVIHVTSCYRLTNCQFTNEPNREILASHCLVTGAKMASRFETFGNTKFERWMKQSYKQIPRSRPTLPLRCLLV